MFLLTVARLSSVCHSAYSKSSLIFWVSWNGLKSKNISDRSSYSRHLNYYVSKGMTASVRKADVYPCSNVVFILELGAIINYLGLRQPWTPYIPFIPGVVGGLTLSILLLFLCCWTCWWSQISKHDKSSCSAPWAPAVTAGKAGLRERAQEQLFRKTPPVFLDNHCLISRHCWFNLLPISFHLSGHGSASSAASWFQGRGGVPHTPHCAAYGTKNIKREVN